MTDGRSTNHRGLDRLRIGVGIVIVCAWVGSLLLDAFVTDYDPPATVHLLMMVVAGAIFGPSITGPWRRNDRD